MVVNMSIYQYSSSSIVDTGSSAACVQQWSAMLVV